eukprot:snap_masked-scaffold_7-processed-gene-11.2-mRNA-1 protein AED:1.00 eAED:1.00 QI:0/-1/0/0/-1/1/1/0/781
MLKVCQTGNTLQLHAFLLFLKQKAFNDPRFPDFLPPASAFIRVASDFLQRKNFIETQTAFSYLIVRGNLSSFKLLLQYISKHKNQEICSSLDVTDESGLSALHYIILFNRVTFLENLFVLYDDSPAKLIALFGKSAKTGTNKFKILYFQILQDLMDVGDSPLILCKKLRRKKILKKLQQYLNKFQHFSESAEREIIFIFEKVVSESLLEISGNDNTIETKLDSESYTSFILCSPEVLDSFLQSQDQLSNRLMETPGNLQNQVEGKENNRLNMILSYILPPRQKKFGFGFFLKLLTIFAYFCLEEKFYILYTFLENNLDKSTKLSLLKSLIVENSGDGLIRVFRDLPLGGENFLPMFVLGAEHDNCSLVKMFLGQLPDDYDVFSVTRTLLNISLEHGNVNFSFCLIMHLIEQNKVLPTEVETFLNSFHLRKSELPLLPYAAKFGLSSVFIWATILYETHKVSLEVNCTAEESSKSLAMLCASRKVLDNMFKYAKATEQKVDLNYLDYTGSSFFKLLLQEFPLQGESIYTYEEDVFRHWSEVDKARTLEYIKGNLDLFEFDVTVTCNVFQEYHYPQWFVCRSSRLMGLALQLGLDVNQVDSLGMTYLYRCVQLKWESSISYLLKYKPKDHVKGEYKLDVNRQDNEGWNILLYYARFNRFDKARQLLKFAENNEFVETVDLNRITKDGYSSIMLCARYGWLDFCKVILRPRFLFQRYFIDVTKQIRIGARFCTAEQMALENNHNDVAKMIRNHTSVIGKELPPERTKNLQGVANLLNSFTGSSF